MCNLYTVRRSRDEVAGFFRARKPPVEPNLPDDILPGSPGLVVREADGGRVLQSMVWGFPMRFASMKPGSKPVNNIADITKFTWKALAQKPPSRCLIPLTRFAEPEGPKGGKTRTWVTVKDQPIVAWAGLWRDSEEWGPVYSGAMTDCNDAMRPLHDRMPVLLLPDELEVWLHGSFDEVVALQKRSFPNELIEITPTQELWVPKRPGATADKTEKATLI